MTLKDTQTGVYQTSWPISIMFGFACVHNLSLFCHVQLFVHIIWDVIFVYISLVVFCFVNSVIFMLCSAFLKSELL